jgi:NDP-sugar pyrophosphorylase family protein
MLRAMRRAIVLAGGQGTRLLPYTAVIPKPLLPLGDRPVLDIVIRQLRAAGFERVTIATGHLAELIEAFFRDGRNHGIAIDYFREQEPLGTVGALALMDGLDDPFLVMNGDVLTDMDYGAFLAHHVASGVAATIATTTRHIQISLGVMRFGDPAAADRVTDYVEKPQLAYDVSMGVYCFAPRVVDYIEPGVRLDFPDLVLRLLDRHEHVHGFRPDAYWMDLGRPDDYAEAQREFEALRDRFLPADA